MITIGVLYLFALLPYLNHALSEDQKAMINEHKEKLAAECMKDNPITEDDQKKLKAHQMATGDGVPCFLACMMKSVAVIDEKGMLRKDKAIELAKQVLEDPEELKSVEDFFHSCLHINDAAVTDGDKGCERASKAYKCMIENASKFGFSM